MFSRGKSKFDARVTISDLARMYDKRMGGKAPTHRYQHGDVPESGFKPKNFTVSQGDTRLARLKARASGIRYALQTENLEPRKARELEHVLKNLELAIRGMEASLKEP